MEAKKPIMEEEMRMRRLRLLVDLTAAALATESLMIDEALDLINGAKHAALNLFPGSEHTFDIIYKRRFGRILRERFTVSGSEKHKTEVD